MTPDRKDALPVKHSQGPWQFELYPSGGFEIESPTGGHAGGTLIIASRNSHRNVEVMHANARLIAAAPDLLEALRDVIGWVPGPASWHTGAPAKAVERARAALSKATGEQA
jgi:hypothetical protein